MFQRARLKLTAWYLLTIMLVSLGFSFGIYRLLTNEILRFSVISRNRIGLSLTLQSYDESLSPYLLIADDSDLVNDATARVTWGLIVVNGVIFILAGGLSYLVAGKALRPLQVMLEEQKRFISDSSHELRTPLTALKSTIEVNLRDRHLTLKEARLVLQDSLEEVNRLNNLSNSLLQLTHYQDNKFDLHPAQVNLEQLVTVVVKRFRGLAVTKKIAIQSQLNSVQVTGDAASLSELISILLDNAIKYSQAHSHINILLTKYANEARLVVADEGIGIKPADLPRLFDRFFRADKARTITSERGYGLGLTIARTIVQLHHGTISVASQPKRGSTFTVVLPI